MKNTILLILILILNISAINAQQYKTNSIKEYNLNKDLLSNEEFFEKAELIIEGKMLCITSTYDAKGNYKPEDIYSEYKIFVRHVYKGDTSLINDTICLVKKAGTIYIEKEPRFVEEGIYELNVEEINSYGDIPPSELSDRGLSISKDFSSILFFVKSDYPENPDKSNSCPNEKFKLLQNKEKASLKFGDGSWSTIDNWRFGKITGLNDLVFNNKKELHDYMQQFKGIKYPEKRELKFINAIKNANYICIILIKAYL